MERHTPLITLAVRSCVRAHARARGKEGRLLTYMCEHARSHANIHNPDADDSLYPFANQLYMSTREREQRGATAVGG